MSTALQLLVSLVVLLLIWKFNVQLRHFFGDTPPNRPRLFIALLYYAALSQHYGWQIAPAKTDAEFLANGLFFLLMALAYVPSTQTAE